MSDFGLKEADFKGLPGYTQKPAKVWKFGRQVDGYTWNYRAPKQKQSKRQIDMQELEQMIAPATRRHQEQAATAMGKRNDAVLMSPNGLEYVPPERAQNVADRNGWKPRIQWGKPKETTVYHADGTTTTYRRGE